MSTNTHDTAGTKLQTVCHRMPVDAVDNHFQPWAGQTEGWIAQKRVLQFVGGRIAATAHKVALRPACSLSDADARCQHVVGKAHVHHFVIGSIDGAGSAEEGHTPTLLIEHHGLTDILFLPVEGHDVARGCHPEGQSHRRCSLEVGEFHHQLMREGVGRSVPAVVHHQCTTLHLLLDEPCHVRIAVARR